MSVLRLFRCPVWSLHPRNSCNHAAMSVRLSGGTQCQMSCRSLKRFTTSAALSSHGYKREHLGLKQSVQLPTPSVAVFWDWENCPLSLDGMPSRLSALRHLAQTLGHKITFKVYLDRAQQSSANATAIRWGLCSAGLELIDCPHDGMKEVVDKAITVDMFEYALDNPVPSSLVLISGDRGYTPLLSRLSWRGYHVVLVAPVTAEAGLRLVQCDAIYEWSDRLALLQSEESVDLTQPSETDVAQAQPAPSSIPLRSSKKLPGDTFFSSAAKPVARFTADTMSQESGELEDMSAHISQPVVTEPPNLDASNPKAIVVEPKFQDLVDVLIKLRNEGHEQVPYVLLGTRLREKGQDVFKKVRVPGLKGLVVLAESKEIVIFQNNAGSNENEANRYVSLHPRLLPP